MFSGRKKLLGVLGVGLLVATIGAGGVAMAQGGSDPTPPVLGVSGDDEEAANAITGDALAKASEAALAHTGGGTVTDTEQGDEESFYEVEVTLADGSQVDVQLDKSFNVVGDKPAEVGEDAGEGEHGENDAETQDGTAGEAAAPSN